MTIEIFLALFIFYLTRELAIYFKTPLLKSNFTSYCLCAVSMPIGIYTTALIVEAIHPHYAENVLLNEDGIFESVTALMYLWAAYSIIRLPNKKAFDYILLILCFFIVGEEISWGQRIIGLESTSWWNSLNSQNETNLHNIEIGGILVGLLIIIPGTLYFLFGSFLVKKFSILQKATEYLGLPIPKPHITISLITAFLLNSVIDINDNNELMEICISITVVWFVRTDLTQYKKQVQLEQ